MRDPPKRRNTEKTEEEDELVKKDPWQGFRRRGGGDGDGGGGGGDAGDGDDGNEDDGADGFFIGTPEGQGRGGRGPKKAHEYEFGELFEALLCWLEASNGMKR